MTNVERDDSSRPEADCGGDDHGIDEAQTQAPVLPGEPLGGDQIPLEKTTASDLKGSCNAIFAVQ